MRDKNDMYIRIWFEYGLYIFEYEHAYSNIHYPYSNINSTYSNVHSNIRIWKCGIENSNLIFEYGPMGLQIVDLTSTFKHFPLPRSTLSQSFDKPLPLINYTLHSFVLKFQELKFRFEDKERWRNELEIGFKLKNKGFWKFKVTLKPKI
jgi:hypothetical protein